MDKTKALEGITINAAKNCGISESVGSIKTGKDADLVICKKLPWEFEYEAKTVFINGEKVK